jgi:NAD(P)-dependent dehydrogenase (short-subunit alcohol dehydrogenase family)
MSNKKVWFITGAGRGMGVDFAKAALAAGHAVVATGRDQSAVSRAAGPSNDLLAVKLDVTRSADPRRRFGRPWTGSAASTCSPRPTGTSRRPSHSTPAARAT